MWLFYERTTSDWSLEKAQHYSKLIEERKYDRDVHDLGSLFWSTWKRWYDLTGDEEIKETVITAGKTLGMRFKECGHYLSSFVADDSLFIDIMMNIGIIFYAALDTDDQMLLAKANQHCLTTRRYLVRGDGSTSHEGLFNLKLANSFDNAPTKVGVTTHPGRVVKHGLCTGLGQHLTLHRMNVTSEQLRLAQIFILLEHPSKQMRSMVLAFRQMIGKNHKRQLWLRVQPRRSQPAGY